MSLTMHAADEKKPQRTLEAAAAPTQSVSVGGPSYDTGKIAGLYDLEETLGSGHFAVVKLARHVFTGAKVAVKVVDKTKLDEVSKAHLFQEVRCMKLVQHPNVVRLYEVIDTQTKLYLVLELGDGGDLYDYIMRHDGGLSEELARKYFRQILRAISYCHQLHVVHRDLKPENVVFFEKLGVVKLTDFGFSNKFSPGQKLETFCGSLAYSAPEILLGDSYDAPAVDIWSLGVILYMLVCGQPPFEKANDSETLTMIMDCKYTVPPHISQSCRQLIGSMLVRDPKKRASLEQIAADAWLKDNADYEISMNDYLPLVSRQELSEEDHAFIIQKMINGNIATKEEIQQSLDKNKYNHITATYYLLAEIRLRKRREEHQKTQLLLGKKNCPDAGRAGQQQLLSDNKANPAECNKVVVPISINVCSSPSTAHATEAKADKRSRKCSIVREEDEDESSYEYAGDSNELSVAATRRESISDGRLNRSVLEQRAVNLVATNPVAATATTSSAVLKPPANSARSKVVVPVDALLAQKLNRIDAHPAIALVSSSANSTKAVSSASATNRSTKEDRPSAMQDALRSLKELEIGKFKTSLAVAAAAAGASKNPVLTHRRTKLNKIRTPSCSSSEASDDDTKARSKKKINKFVGDTPTRFRMHRRDSHDDSSDSQDPAFPSSGSHGAAAGGGGSGHATSIIPTNSSNVGGKKDGQSQGKEQNKSEETRKSSHSHSHKNKNKHPKEHVHVEKHSSQLDDTQTLSTLSARRRIRESQSLDRITESQEYELRHRCLAVDTHIDQRNSLFNLNSFSAVAETKEEYDEESEVAFPIESDQLMQHNSNNKNSINAAEMTLQLSRDKNNIYSLNSIEEIDLILEDKSLSKAIHVTGSKCFVTMKKIRRLGKYFPVVNFS